MSQAILEQFAKENGCESRNESSVDLFPLTYLQVCKWLKDKGFVRRTNTPKRLSSFWHKPGTDDVIRFDTVGGFLHR